MSYPQVEINPAVGRVRSGEVWILRVGRPPQEEAMSIQKVIQYGAIAFVIFFVVTSPNSAADLIHSGLNGLRDLGHGVSEFVSSL
jgi:hypothetical protein